MLYFTKITDFNDIRTFAGSHSPSCYHYFRRPQVVPGNFHQPDTHCTLMTCNINPLYLFMSFSQSCSDGINPSCFHGFKFKILFLVSDSVLSFLALVSKDRGVAMHIFAVVLSRNCCHRTNLRTLSEISIGVGANQDAIQRFSNRHCKVISILAHIQTF